MSQSAKDVLELSLDVSAVPEQPAGAGRYVVELARALAKRPDCGLTLLARRDDARRWARVAPAGRVSAIVPPPATARRAPDVRRKLRRLGPPDAEAIDAPVCEVTLTPFAGVSYRTAKLTAKSTEIAAFQTARLT